MKKTITFLLLFTVGLTISAEDESLPGPSFSHPEGFYSESFELEILCPGDFPQAWLTFNGSYPGPDNAESVLYTSPVLMESREGDPNVFSLIPLNNGDSGLPEWLPPAEEVMKATIVGAVCVNGENEMSQQSFRTYFVELDSVLSFNVPIISIIAPPDSLFGFERGIMVPGIHYVPGQNRTGNYAQRGDEWERMMHVSFFEPDGQLGFGHFAGLRIHGNFTRGYPQKGLRLYSRSDYGTSRFDYKLFENQPQQRFNRFILRASGNDWVRTMFRDAVGQRFIDNLPIETQDYRPSVVFINGEFWGIHNMRERYDIHYFTRYYDLDDEDEIDYIDFAFRRAPFINEGDSVHYMEMLDFALENDLSLPENYAHMQTLMDMDNYLLMIAVGVYSSNTDWPQTNVRAWRTRNDFNEEGGMKDGRWRWLINDLDFGFGLFQQATHNNLERLFEDDKWYNELFLALMDNECFKNKLISLLANLMHSNMNAEYTNTLIDATAQRLENIMPMHIDRWQYPNSPALWNHNVNSFKNWMVNRPEHMRQQIVDQFELEGIAPFTIHITEPDAGLVKLNSMLISDQTPGIPSNPYPFEAVYFAGIPVRLEAIADAGYRFDGWTGYESNEPVITVDPAIIDDITAIFVYEPFEGDEMNPVAHNLADGDYMFDYWGSYQPELTFPNNMIFQQTQLTDPALRDEMSEPYFVPEHEYHEDDLESIGFPYALTRRTRINALGENGISFINTGRGRDLGAAVLALNLKDVDDAYVSFTAGTVLPNSRVYAVRLQYRLGNLAGFSDLLTDDGEPIEYLRNTSNNHEMHFRDIRLPEETIGHHYVQLRWKYYHVDVFSGPRAELRLDNIVVRTESTETHIQNRDNDLASQFKLHQNYPNPFQNTTSIGFFLPVKAHVTLEVFALTGQRFVTLANGYYNSGNHEVSLHANMLPSGLYVYRILIKDDHSVFRQTRKMLLQHCHHQ